jgi:hypothetical protein
MSLLGQSTIHRPAAAQPAHVDTVIYPRFAAYLRRRYGVDVSRAAFDRVYDRPALRVLLVRRALESE